jgi:hypothetical protein
MDTYPTLAEVGLGASEALLVLDLDAWSVELKNNVFTKTFTYSCPQIFLQFHIDPVLNRHKSIMIIKKE